MPEIMLEIVAYDDQNIMYPNLFPFSYVRYTGSHVDTKKKKQ